jgi:RNA polymerase sigma factor (sigma-70 family)
MKESELKRQSALNETLTRLIHKIAEGDEKSFSIFYAQSSRQVFAVALRLTRNVAAAEEVVETSYWQVWREAVRYDASRGAVMAWILTICRSRALDYLRQVDPAESYEDMDGFAEAYTVKGSSPLEKILDAERNGQLHSAIEQLKPIQKQLIGLAFFKGMTQQEIADFMPLPLGTVKTNIRSALQELAVHLGTNFEAMTNE